MKVWFKFGLLAMGISACSASLADASASTAWADSVDGTWLEAEKWTNGVPTEGSVAEIIESGDYTVTMQYLVTDIPSVIRVGSGATLDVACQVSTWQYPMELLEDGRLLISNRSLLTPNVFSRFTFSGGEVEYAAVGLTNVWGKSDASLTNVNIKLSGDSRTGIGDNGVTGLRLGLVATTAEKTSKLQVADTARLWLNGGEFRLGAYGQEGVAEFAIAEGGTDSDLVIESQPKSMTVGYEAGTSKVVQASRKLEFTEGVYLGAVQSEWFDQSAETRLFKPIGVYEQSGGTLQVNGLSALTANRPTGVLIGDGSRPGSVGQSFFTGIWRLSDGLIDCRRAYLMIGLGYGYGILEQTGGTVRQNVKAAEGSFAPTVIGWKGGSGKWSFKGESSAVEFGSGASLYIGGMDDSHLLKSFSWVTIYSVRAKGVLEIDDSATFRAPDLTVLGESGEGAIEIGPTGTFKGTALKVTSGSSSSISFTAGASGFGAMQLSGAFEADSTAKIVVDFATRPLVGKATLIEAASISGISAENVEVKNVPSEREVEITVDETRVVVGLKSGSLVIVR